MVHHILCQAAVRVELVLSGKSRAGVTRLDGPAPGSRLPCCQPGPRSRRGLPFEFGDRPMAPAATGRERAIVRRPPGYREGELSEGSGGGRSGWRRLSPCLWRVRRSPRRLLEQPAGHGVRGDACAPGPAPDRARAPAAASAMWQGPPRVRRTLRPRDPPTRAAQQVERSGHHTGSSPGNSERGALEGGRTSECPPGRRWPTVRARE